MLNTKVFEKRIFFRVRNIHEEYGYDCCLERERDQRIKMMQENGAIAIHRIDAQEFFLAMGVGMLGYMDWIPALEKLRSPELAALRKERDALTARVAELEKGLTGQKETVVGAVDTELHYEPQPS